MSEASPQAARRAVSLRMADGAQADLLLFLPAGAPRATLLWVPALGVAARHYEPLAQSLAALGIAVGVHEWRGHGSSDQRAGRGNNWGYRALLADDLPHSLDALAHACPGAPLYVGGHSLGGQLGSLLATITPVPLAGLVLVASGAPYWRRFHPWVGLAYIAAPTLANLVGRLPGRRIGFGGNEARGVIADWSRSGRTGRYAARGMPVDFEAALRRQARPVLALRLRDDWLGPEASLAYLLDKMPAAPRTVGVIGPDDLAGAKADHFGWMKMPARIAERIAAWMP
ncbi:alpha/beta hydrolase family protein [Luteibacter yeojuensis]|uniref:Alpha/beta hydrolase n=1 Tax=Luteibacter yeojuensis TaxID=345309 RepID=A0A0F3L107_9GAMM|nr:alpha/beta fold hydrolase [Luteibacter yeojuensis]KJV37066.1 alpha/beta hydrolase [Luteibacter yeojuensis]